MLRWHSRIIDVLRLLLEGWLRLPILIVWIAHRRVHVAVMVWCEVWILAVWRIHVIGSSICRLIWWVLVLHAWVLIIALLVHICLLGVLLIWHSLALGSIHRLQLLLALIIMPLSPSPSSLPRLLPFGRHCSLLAESLPLDLSSRPSALQWFRYLRVAEWARSKQ